MSKLFAFSTAEIKSGECTSSTDSLEPVGVAVVSSGFVSVGVAVVSTGASVGVVASVGVAVVSTGASVGVAVVSAVSVAGATGFTSSANV